MCTNISYPKVYVDEAGNTGANICDEKQKYFVLSAVSFTDEELLRIKQDINYPKELHFVNMKRSVAGRTAIKNILSHPLIDENHISYQIIDKSFCIYAQMIDYIVEPVFHYILKQDIYKKRGNILLANVLYVFAKNHKNQKLVNQLKLAFVRMMRSQNSDSVRDFYDIVKALKDDTDTSDSFVDILSCIKMSSQILEEVLIEDKKYGLDTMLTSLISMINHWYEKFFQKLHIISDDSKQFIEQQRILYKLAAIPEEKIVGYDTRKQKYPLPMYKFEMCSSQDSFGVQLADIIASAVAFRWNASTRDQKFHQEIAQYPFFDIPCYPIFPASVDKLTEVVDSSEDEDPFEFLAKHFER